MTSYCEYPSKCSYSPNPCLSVLFTYPTPISLCKGGQITEGLLYSFGSQQCLNYTHALCTHIPLKPRAYQIFCLPPNLDWSVDTSAPVYLEVTEIRHLPTRVRPKSPNTIQLLKTDWNEALFHTCLDSC